VDGLTDCICVIVTSKRRMDDCPGTTSWRQN